MHNLRVEVGPHNSKKDANLYHIWLSNIKLRSYSFSPSAYSATQLCEPALPPFPSWSPLSSAPFLAASWAQSSTDDWSIPQPCYFIL